MKKYFNILTIGFALIGYVGCIKALNFPKETQAQTQQEYMKGIFKLNPDSL